MFQELSQYIRSRSISGRTSMAILYGITTAVAMNFFWKPNNIYSSGFTGLAQVCDLATHGAIPVSTWLIIVNIPTFILSLKYIGRRFTFFTLLSVVMASLLIHLIPMPNPPIVSDSLIASIFGGVLNGFGSGTALKYGVGTGGLDIVSVVARKRDGIKIMPINVAFNAVIMIATGILKGWPNAFYSMIGIFISAWVVSLVYTRQQQMQVMIISGKQDAVIEALQKRLRRGITVIDHAQGAYLGDKKEVIFTVITREEIYDMHSALKESDPNAFASTWKVDNIYGRFRESDY